MTRTVLTAACLFLMGANMALADDTLWTRYFRGDRDCYGRTLLVDHDDNIIAVGTWLGAGTGNDVGVVKVSPDGTRLWFVTVAGPGAYNDEAKGAALDPDGNIYVTALSGLFPDFDIMTVKLDPTGSEVWRRTWGGPDNKQDVPAGIVVDTAGNAYVTGYTTAANCTADWVTMKLTSDSGLPLWTVVRPGGDGVDFPTAIALGPGDAPYITG
ncbi:MAG: SBBP repeat-containing protein [candidate division WOR-3 bacterium]|nr:SBBP repeat-containing protein [candidate division WOR-3 bacterium]